MKKVEKQPFKFRYTRLSLDWFEYVNVEVNWDDFVFFELQLRFSNTWWLIGCKKKKDEFDWKEEREKVELGNLQDVEDVNRFIEWCQFDGGSKLVTINCLSTGLDMFNELKRIIKVNRIVEQIWNRMENDE